MKKFIVDFGGEEEFESDPSDYSDYPRYWVTYSSEFAAISDLGRMAKTTPTLGGLAMIKVRARYSLSRSDCEDDRDRDRDKVRFCACTNIKPDTDIYFFLDAHTKTTSRGCPLEIIDIYGVKRYPW